jgi:hypothetical protein
VIGQSDRTASAPATKPITPADLMATVMHTLFDRGKLRLEQSVPADVNRAIGAGTPIAELV